MISEICFLLHQEEKSFELSKKAIELNPFNSNIYFSRGSNYYLLKNIDSCEEFFEKAIQVELTQNEKLEKPYHSFKLSIYHNQLCLIKLELNKVVEAIECTLKSIEFNLKDPLIQFNNFSKMIELSEIKKELKRFYNDRGILVYNYFTKYNLALEDFTNAINSFPDDPDFYFNLAVLL